MKSDNRSAALLAAACLIVCFFLPGPARALDDAKLQQVLDGADARREVMLKHYLANPPSAKRNVMWDYNKWTLNGWYNIADFARDPVTRRRMRMFLDLYWADWAIEQIDAVRGGSRHRCYPGPGSTESSDGGDGPCWYLFGVGKPAGTNPALVGRRPRSTGPRPWWSIWSWM